MSSLPTSAPQYVVSHPSTGTPTLSGPNSTFALNTADIPSAPPSGKLLLKTLYLSNDPAQRVWIDPSIPPTRLYTTPVRKGEVMRARGIAQVLASGPDTTIRPGQKVIGGTGWSQYCLMDEKDLTLMGPLPGGLPETTWLGALGLTGLTAWHGLIDVAECTSEDNCVVVSGAAGATGSVVVQLAKRVLGCKKVVGIAGGEDKCRWVREVCGADACLDYKISEEQFAKKLAEETAGFVDVFFDNVAGPVLDAVLTRMKPNGRIAACGAISGYNEVDKTKGYGVRNWFEIISNRITVKGFIVTDAASRYGEIVGKLREAIEQGKLKLEGEASAETVVETKFEGVPKVWMKLFEGGNRGKLITKIVD